MGLENDPSYREDQMKKLENLEVEGLPAEIELLYSVSMLLNSASDLDEVVRAVALPGINSGATGAVLFTFELDQAGQPEWVQVAAALPAQEMLLQPIGSRFYLPDFPAVQRWLSNPDLGLLIDDIEQEQQLDQPTRHTFLPTGTSAVAVMPLIHRERWVGMVMITWPIPHPFTSGDHRLYRSLASQAAVVVDNRLLLEQAQRRAAQLEKLTKVEVALSRAGHEADILKAIALLERTVQNAQMTLSYLDIDETGRPVAARPIVSWYQGIVKMEPQTPDSTAGLEHLPAVSLWLNAPDAVLFIEDLLTDPRVTENGWSHATRNDIRSMVVIPLRSSGRWQGIITLCWSTPRVFTTDERFILRRLLESAAATVASRRAYQAQQEARNFLDSIIENIPISVFIKDAQDLKFVRWNRASEELFGYRQKDMLGKSDYDFFPKEEADFFVAKDREVLANIAPLEIPEESILTAHKGPRVLRTMKTPITGIDGQPKYLLGVSEDITERKQTEEKLAKLVAELQTVAEVSMVAATTQDVPGLLQTVVDLTKERFGLYHAHIYLLDEETRVLKLAAGAGETGKKMTAEEWHIPLEQEQSLVARAARSRQGLISNDVQQDQDWLPNPLLPNTRAEMAIAMIAGDRLLGVLDVQSDTVNHFTQDDLRVQSILAAQVAVAIQNVRLLEQARTRAHQEQILREITARVRSSADPDIVVRAAVRELSNALGRPAFVRLGSDQELLQPPLPAAGDTTNADKPKDNG